MRECFRRARFRTALVGVFLFAATAFGADLSTRFQEQIHPLLKKYCLDCHSTESQKGDLDLERFRTVGEVKRHPKVWQHVLEQLSNGEMPPEKKPQPSTAERQELKEWTVALLDEVARSRAGDPGPVLLRRLSNAEYTYTIRDLTGVDALDPAREFPVDGAAGEGFMNTGSALVMSPSLFTKYFDAGKEIASHAMLLPDGFRFSPNVSRRDWAQEILGRIRDFYARYTTIEGSEKVNLQGIVFDTNEGGRLPLRKYLAATIEERRRLASGGESFDAVSKERGLSAKYLRILWEGLNAKGEAMVLGPLRERWLGAQAADVDLIVKEVSRWQKALWKFSTVGHIGKAGGPKAWLEEVEAIADRQVLRLKLPKGTNDTLTTVYLVATDIGDGNENDVVVWLEPRLVFPEKGKAAVPLKDSGATISPRFGKLPDGRAIDESSLALQAPGFIEIRLPTAIAAGAEFVVTGTLHPEAGREGSVQLQVTTEKPRLARGLAPGEVNVKNTPGPWTSQQHEWVQSAPIVVHSQSEKRKKLSAEFTEFRRLFPAALCYSKIVPVDEVVTLTLAHREDEHLKRLMLDEAQARNLDRLWEEYNFVSQNALLLVDAFEQLWQYATQDADPKVFEPMRTPIAERAAAFRKWMVECEPKQVEAVVEFARKAYRRPLATDESEALRGLYRKLRAEDLGHDEAFRNMLARVFAAPAFLYRLEKAPEGDQPGPVSNWELATRLSYFLWSSVPDEELRQIASEGRLMDNDVLSQQARRMLRDPRTRRLAVEFGCQWLHIHGFDELDEKSERHFPEFAALRKTIYEEPIRFFTDLFQENRPVLNIVEADYTFVNKPLAKFYNISGFAGEDWQRIDRVKDHGRGGALGFAATLAKQSGASRTSPILRGNWILEVLLGEKLPRPPKDVPVLPDEDNSAAGLTVRQLVEKHSSDPRCSGCHQRLDPYGFALEHFDAIGRRRERDSANPPINAKTKLMNGPEVDGLEGLRRYLAHDRRDAFVRQFCRKLLGYALGRAVQLSDEPLLTEMQSRLKADDFRVWNAVETIVQSPQFHQIRGRDSAFEDNL
jgi:hypothetical protein